MNVSNLGLGRAVGGGSGRRRGLAESGATLAETVVSLALAVITVTGTVNGYLFTNTRAEWSAYSLAAHSLALQRVEQVRAAKWDTGAYPPVDLVTASQFPATTEYLDLPISGTNMVVAACLTTIRQVSVDPPLKLVRVDCIWPFHNGQWFTNTITVYRAPDQ